MMSAHEGRSFTKNLLYNFVVNVWRHDNFIDVVYLDNNFQETHSESISSIIFIDLWNATTLAS